MARLIDVSELQELKWEYLETAWGRGWNSAIDAVVDYAPTVDAVKVVRCKDCKHWSESIFLRGEQGQRVGLCDCTMYMKDADFFAKREKGEKMAIPKYFYFRVRVINKGTGLEVENASDVDVVEVVRCKDCIYSGQCLREIIMRQRIGNLYCPLGDNGYCSMGRRREDAETN